MGNDDRLIIEVSKRINEYGDYLALQDKGKHMEDGSFLYFTDGKTHNSDSYNFCFIDQDINGLGDAINNILNNTSNTNVCIAVHYTDRPINAINQDINISKKKSKVVKVREFSHERTDDIWEQGLKPFIVQSIVENFQHYGEKFDILWKLLAVSHKSHVIALSILCQGYLAAHGGEGLGEEWKKVWEKLPDNLKDNKNPYQLIEEKRNTTKDKNIFWKKVIGDKKNVEDELKGLDKKDELNSLLNAIYGADELSVGTVTEAYIALKSILKG